MMEPSTFTRPGGTPGDAGAAGTVRVMGAGSCTGLPMTSVLMAIRRSTYPPLPFETITYAKCSPGPDGSCQSTLAPLVLDKVPSVVRHRKFKVFAFTSVATAVKCTVGPASTRIVTRVLVLPDAFDAVTR